MGDGHKATAFKEKLTAESNESISNDVRSSV